MLALQACKEPPTAIGLSERIILSMCSEYSRIWQVEQRFATRSSTTKIRTGWVLTSGSIFAGSGTTAVAPSPPLFHHEWVGCDDHNL